jgi:hypothetical protein
MDRFLKEKKEKKSIVPNMQTIGKKSISDIIENTIMRNVATYTKDVLNIKQPTSSIDIIVIIP